MLLLSSCSIRGSISKLSLIRNYSSNVYIVGASRTPIGSYLGSLAAVPVTELGSIALAGAIDQCKEIEKDQVQECLMGCVVSANVGQAPARQAALGAGLRESTVCTTINKVCASGLKAVGLGVQSIMLGYHGIVLAGGMESMSRAPFYVDARRGGLRFGDNTITDALLKDGLWDPKYQIHMGVCAEETAKKYGIGREAQDAFARKSYERASDASCTGKFKSEICSVGAVVEDEEYKRVNFDKMLQLKPAFDPSGTITAGNASSLSDGAAAVLLCSKGVMEEKKISRPLARVLSIADSEGNPKEFSTMPSVAIPLALKRAGLSIADVSLFEINEAFSVVVLANQQILGLDPEKVNVYGGGVSLGHPIGSSGARILVTLTHALKPGQIGCAAICNGGGGSSAIVIERL